MAEIRDNRFYGSAYVYGSAAPVRKAEPERRPDPRERRKQIQEARRDIEARVLGKRQAVREVGKLQALVVTASMALLILSISFFIIQTSVHESTALAIEKLELDIQTVHHENIVLQNLKNSSIDYNVVYKTATEEFGMTVPMKQQVVHYTRTAGEYVEKNGDIPR